MKKLWVLFIVALLAMGAFAGVVSAARVPGAEGGQWEQAFNPDGTNAQNAIVFRLGETQGSECNVSPRSMTVDVRAFVAQWAKFEMAYEGWEWYVKKPGTYYADCIEGKIKSNGGISISFSGFSNLVREDNEQETNDTIKLWLGYAPGTTTDHNAITWVPAAQMSQLNRIILPDSMEMHGGYAWKLWNKIEVVDCNSPGLYEMSTGTITFHLLNQAAWIDKLSGNFDPTYFTPANNYRGYTPAVN